MKRALVTMLMLTLIAAGAWAGEAGGEVPNDDATTVQSRINSVTVYADRAQVTRIAEINAPAGSSRYAFRKLPGWLDEGFVRVTLDPPTSGEIFDVQVIKTFLARAKEEEVRKAQDAVQEIEDRAAEIEDERKVLDARKKQIESIRVFSLEKLPKDAATKDFKIETYGQVLDFISKSLGEVAKSRRALDKKLRELQPERDARRRRLQELRQRAQLEQRTVLVSLKPKAAGKTRLKLTYMVPGATWEPNHDLRATPNGGNVSLRSYAIVTQTTGEDWSEADIALSTQRSSATIRLPELQALLVGSGRTVARLVNGQNDSFRVATKNYRKQRDLWNKVNNPNQMELQQEFDYNAIRLDAVQQKAQRVFRALQQRGTTAHFQAIGDQTVRTDGRPVRLPIGTLELPAGRRIMAAPELSLNAARTIDLSNKGTMPLLPGNVSLYLGGAFLGKTELGFVAQGESFSLFLGVADQIKLSRVMDKKRSSLQRGGSRTRMQVSYLVTAENLANQQVALQLADRVPVSQNEQIRVKNVRVTPDGMPDAKGLIRWNLALSPKEKRAFRVEYTIEYPTSLPQQRRARQAAPAQQMGEEALEDQIIELEKKF